MSSSLPAPAGNPSALNSAIDRYQATELAIASAAEELASIVMDGDAQSIDAVRERATTARSHLEQAHGRYSGTRSALRAYAVELTRFHQSANAAIERDYIAHAEYADASDDLTRAVRKARGAAMNPDDQSTLDYWETQAHWAHNRKDAAESAMAAAQADYQRAADALESAAQVAISLIEASFDGTQDGRYDGLKNALASIGSFLSSLADWVTDFFEAVFEAIVEAIELFVAAIILAIAVIALVVVIVQLLSMALMVLAAALVLVIAVLALLIAIVAPILIAGVSTYLVATALGVDDLTRIRMVVNAILNACPPLELYITWRIHDELAQPAPVVTELDPDDLPTRVESDARKTQDQLEQSAPDTLSDFLWQAGAVDTIGGADQSVVDIAKIVHEDGTVSWIVTLPSTKDWVGLNDQGATNDLDADLLLLLYPEYQSQYEKAVLDAMAQAGIGPDEPVLLTGWSLGGILGGELIQSEAGGYNYGGLVVAGSPIDHMAIPEDIPVVQVKHFYDPVHRLDMIDQTRDTPNHVSVWDGDRSGIGMETKLNDQVAHDARLYKDTLQAHVTADQTLNDKFSDFFVVDDPNHTGKPTIEHTQYAFSE